MSLNRKKQIWSIKNHGARLKKRYVDVETKNV